MTNQRNSLQQQQQQQHTHTQCIKYHINDGRIEVVTNVKIEGCQSKFQLFMVNMVLKIKKMPQNIFTKIEKVVHQVNIKNIACIYNLVDILIH